MKRIHDDENTTDEIKTRSKIRNIISNKKATKFHFGYINVLRPLVIVSEINIKILNIYEKSK